MASRSSEVSPGYFESVARTLEKLLTTLVVSPQQALKDINYLSDRHEQQIRDWSQAPSQQVDACIHDLVYQHAVTRPQREAVCAWDGVLTYRELWTYVQQLAQLLTESGVGSETIVPLCFEKSVWSVVAMLAVLEAGAGFCPLDATQPNNRVGGLVSRLEARILLCSRKYSEALAGVADRILPIDSQALADFHNVRLNKTDRGKPENVAYVLWTSGSTGEPKGVVVEHRAYCSAAKTHAPTFYMTEDSRALQYASAVFDASLVEILTALMIGATTCIPSEHMRANNLSDAVNQLRVNWAALTPSVVNFLTPSMVPGLKTLLLMGEVMSQEHIETWSSINLVNGYGPAEASVAAVANTDVTFDREPTLIGSGIGVRCWLVDPENHNRLVPPGCVGELAIEGATLARGYLKDPERTNDSFVGVPDCAATRDNHQSTRRMYKTGDLVRYRTSDGSLYFLGRKDTQVKVHGQRIELGEIEHHLSEEPAIRQSIVIMPKAGFCKQRLVAVVSLPGELTADTLMNAGDLQLVSRAEQEIAQPIIDMARQRLSDRLPAFMVPPLWLVVYSIPLLRSGKLDRKKVLHRVQDLSEESYSQWIDKGGESEERPASELENRLRDIWGHALNLKSSKISLQHSFLSLGGDSISAMMVQSECKKNGFGVTVQDILRAKSIPQLAGCVQQVGQQTVQSERIEELFDLSPIQNLYFELPNRGKGHFNQSAFVRLRHEIQYASMLHATKAIVSRHSMLRARFCLSAQDDEWKQRITTDVAGSYSFRTHDCRSIDDAVPIMSNTQASLDAVNGPLFAVDLFHLESGAQLLFMTGHHLVVDLVSWRVILQDVEELLTHPKAAAQVQPALSFQTWCTMQVEHSHKLPINSLLPKNDIPAQSYAYWEMDGKPNPYGDVRCEGFQLDTSATTLATSSCHEAMGTDTVDILIATMLYSFSEVFDDRGAPTIFNEGHGREVWDPSIDLSRTVGWFTTMYPIHVASPSGDFVDILRRVKDYRRNVPANGRPYFASRMLTSKGAKKFAGHWPLEITFNYLGVYQQLEREDALLLPVQELAGEARAAGGNADVGFDTPRFGLFEISAVIAQGQLRYSFTFNKQMKHQDKITAWISACKETLLTMPSRLAQMDYQPTLTDYPLLSLTYEKLDQLTNDRASHLGITDMKNVEDIYRCSQQQQGLLISTQRDASFYAVQGVYRVNSTSGVLIDSGKLADAWQQVVDRHASLRTIFVESLSHEDALYDQVVLRNVKANILRLKCSTDSDAVEMLRSQANMKHQDLTPSHRFTICNTSNGGVFCKLEISHTIVDGTSMSIIFRELASSYEGRLLSVSAPPYSAYIAFLQDQRPQAGIGYWKSYLKHVEPTMFPTLDDAACTKRELRSKHLRLDDLTDIQQFCNLHGVTVANIFHTAWALTLKCYTGSNDVSYGYLMSTRDSSIENVENLVGYLVNMLVCRVIFTTEEPLIAVMQQVQTDLADCQAHSQTALSEVLHALQLSGSPLFNTSLSYRKIPLSPVGEQHAISFDDCFPYYDPTEYSVSINVEVTAESAAIDLDYWTDSLSEGHAANVLNTFLQAVVTILESSELAIGQLDAISESDYQQISSWNSNMPKTIGRCVHDVVAERMMEHPEKEAVEAWDGTYTYAQLDGLAARLAGYLSILGIGAESYVCLCFEKSASTIIGMLGVLQAGGAFVPLDPMNPAAALEWRIKDTKAQVILTSPCYSAVFAGMGVHVVSIDQPFLERLQPPRKLSLLPGSEPHNPCCIIYTSGSTGKPKGVVLEHKALVTSAHAHGSALGVGPDTRFLQFSSYTFDNNLEEIFTTLMRGGTVCVPSDHERMNDLAGAATRLRANFMDLTPTVATYLNPADMPTIKGMALGGEALTKTVLEVWGDEVEIHNQYGPSECSINSTHRTDIRKSSDPSSIGRSVGSISWIVDPSDHDRLVAIGREGELLIEGPILARGYLNDPEKTSGVFIENPAWASKYAHVVGCNEARRMYKTGDLVRYNSDGTISYIGRKDQQVKLHGQRIELGEIEYHVRSHLEGDWHFAVELIKPGDSAASMKALALFVCPHRDDSVPAVIPEDGLLPVTTKLCDTFKNLEASLARALPKHMVPSLFVPLARLPLTSSGKLDRKQLHAAARSMTDSQVALFRLAGASGREPSTEREKTLANLWETVLNLQPGSIGMDAQFFRMGGDSIAAIRLVTTARSKNIMLTVADIFKNATLSEMSENASRSDAPDLSDSKSDPQPFELLPTAIPVEQIIANIAQTCNVSQNDIEDIYPCTSLQEGLIALSDKQPGAYVAKNRYRLSSIDIEKFKRAWEAVVATEKILRTRIIFTDTMGFLQVVVKEPMRWSTHGDPSGVEETSEIKSASSGASLTDYAIIPGDVGAPYFVWTIHHALYDGWSIELILDKVEAYYNGSETLESVPYSRFMRYLSNIGSNVSESFWKSRLVGTTSPQFPALPKAAYQPQVTGSVSQLLSVSSERSADITLPALIRAAWALTISNYTNSDDVVFAETVNGRDAPVAGITEMIGPAFATIPVRVQKSANATVTEYLKMIQDNCGEAMPHQYMGLQSIKRIDAATAKACECQNLIAINSGALEDNSSFWKLESGETAGVKFFTYALTVSFDVDKLRLRTSAYFDPAVIPEWQVKKLLCHFESALRQLNSPSQASSSISDIRGISDDDVKSIRHWNQEPSVTVNRCIHEIVREKADAVPISCPAICSWDAQLTYLELEHVAASLACHLQQLGVGPRSYIPICFEKSALTVIVMLAILKIGASFVAVDAESPRARQQNIIHDVDAELMLSSPKNKVVCESLGIKVLVLDLPSVLKPPKPPGSLPPCPASGIAYIIFTSGTTGKPKGTLVSHAAFVSGALAHGPAMRIDAKARVLQFASYSFDASIVEIFTTLMLGGCICIPDDTARLNDITKVINEMSITWALLTPSFVQMIQPSDVPTLTTLVLGGEAMTQNNVEAWADSTHLINAYGPSECAVVATVNAHVLPTSSPSNIGRAVGGHCFVVSPSNHEELMPIGAVGELMVTGPILASGYQKNTSKTEESFVPIPLWADKVLDARHSAGSLMYKTGDLVKHAEDGSLLYVARKDNQSKLHGQRLELGEIEHHIGQLPIVKHTIATIPTSGLYHHKLVAVLSCKEKMPSTVLYGGLQLVSQTEARSHVKNIRESLSNQLPPYMVPSNFVLLQDIPLLPSGKLDRRRITVGLEDMSEDIFQAIVGSGDDEGEIQGSAVEQRLQLIWSTVLHLPPVQVGLNQNFVYLGGDSISALQASSKCRAEGLSVTVQDIIRCRSIVDLASRITLPKQLTYDKEEWDKPFQLAPIQRLFFDLVGDNVHHFNQSVVVNLTQRQGSERVSAAVAALSSAHSMLNASFTKSSDGIWTQKLVKENSSSLRFISHGGRFSSAQISSKIGISQRSLDVREGPVFAADLFEADQNGSQVLALVAHHLVIDVVSWRIILEDLESLLTTEKLATHTSLPFQVWTNLQAQRVDLEVSQDVRILKDLPTADYSYWGMLGQPNVYGDVSTLDFALDSETTRDLLGPCNMSLKTDVVDILLGCILYSFSRVFSDRKCDPTVFNEGHGREPWDSNLDLTNTVGWFTTISPVSLPLEACGETDIGKVIRWVKDQRSRLADKGRQQFSHRMLASEETPQPMEIVFNYLGHEKSINKTASLLQPLDGPWSDLDIGPSVPRFGLFEISASVADDRLKLSMAYNRNIERLRDMQAWATELTDSLFNASQHLLEIEPQLTLSDFSLLPLSYGIMESLHKRLPAMGLTSIAELEDVYGCSPMQRGILLSQVKDNEQYMYHTIFSLNGSDPATDIDVNLLSNAWKMVTRKHSSLRTVFIETLSQQGLMDQAVLKTVPSSIVWLRPDITSPEDLEKQDPLLFAYNELPQRLTICQSPNNRVYCRLDLSHAISDGTSMPIIFQDLLDFYNEPQPTINEALLYRDYITHVQQISPEKTIAYWRSYLEGAEPCYFPALGESTISTRELRTLQLALNDLPQLYSFCSQHSVTLSNVLQLVWALVLRAYSGNNDLCFGYLSSGRDVPLPKIDSAVGLFVSMLVCRVNCSADLLVSEMLKQVRDDYAQSTNHQGFYLGDLQHELQLSGKSLFNTAFTFQRRSEIQNEHQKIALEVLHAYDPSEFDITVNVEASENYVSVDFNYYKDWLTDTQAKNISETYAQILRSMISASHANQTIGALDVCGEYHQRQILDWNQEQPPKVDDCVHECIYEQSLILPPSSPAVCSWDQNLTYAELLALSKRLSKHLIALGVEPETYIPICFEKNTWAVVAMLGILFAGGAFVPLEPTHPKSRLEYILNSVNARLVLCSSKYSQKFAEKAEVTTFVVDDSLKLTKEPSAFSRVSSVSPENAAYLIFTSGTTGLPKGTIISHCAFATSATEHAPAILMRSTSRVLQFSNLCFDASIMEIFTTLMTGGCICIPSEEERMNDIPGAIRRMSVNWTLLTPSVANMLDPDKVPSLEVLVTGGEAMQARHISKWHGKASLVNAYGPSECAVIATTSIKVDEDGSVLNNEPAVIGRAVGCRSWIVDPDDYNQLVPIGGIGELVVEGHSVARGYLNEKEKTAKAFVTRPSWMNVGREELVPESNEKMYKTGDLVRYKADGNIIYVSRKDTQIKLNGLRIELGEIEHRVKENMPQNMQTAVAMVAPAGLRQTLAVFFTPETPTNKESFEPNSASGNTDSLLITMSDSAASLCRTLKRKLGGALPAYMIPSLFVPLSQMPWTTSGKLDRGRLCKIISGMQKEAMAPFRLANVGTARTPTTTMEKKLQSLWETILNLKPDSVTLDDSFFVLGGDSVQAMKLVAAARAEQLSLAVQDIFRSPNLSDMVKACAPLQDHDGAVLKPFGLLKQHDSVDQLIDEVMVNCQIDRDQLVDAYPCTALQEGLITLSIKQPGAYVAHNVFRLPEAVDLEQLKAAWQKAVEDLDILRTRIIHSSTDALIQCVLKRDAIEWHKAISAKDVMHTKAPLPEQNGSKLMRMTIIDEGNGPDRYFVWSIHHALYDGWSMPRMLQRVEDIYFDDLTAAATVPYSHFIRYLSEVDGESCNEFWRRKFDGLQCSQFPTSSSTAAGGQSSSELMKYTIKLPKEKSRIGVTLPTIIRAAWAMLMGAHTGSDDIVFGETMTGRDVPIDGIIDMLGPTLTTIPTRIQMDSSWTVTEYLQKVHQLATEVIPYQHAGLQRIRRLNPETATACDFQNLLVIQTAEGEQTESKLWDPQNTGVSSGFFTYPLVVECNAEGSSIHIDAHYNERVISQWHVQKLIYQLESVLGHLCTSPVESKTSLGELQIISQQDLETISSWNNYKPSLVKQCIHSLFLRQAEMTPHAQAVRAWDGNFTYAELQQHAHSLSKHLRKLGVAPEVLVPICMDKSRWALVAQFAVLMAGGAIVPFDPAHPVTRQVEIIRDTNSKILLCSSGYESRFANLLKHVVTVDEQAISRQRFLGHGDFLNSQPNSSNTAYVIFTSGSTGKPKGVVIEHETFCTSSEAFCAAMLMDQRSRVFNFASITFDVGLMENLSPLMIGACVCMPHNDAKMDVASAIDKLAATWAFLTPSVANLIEPDAVPSLRVLVCGGEAMSQDNVSKWADRVSLVNGYGPTEATVISVANPKVTRDTNPTNIGFATSNGYAWITEPNNHNRLAPLGCAGELVLGGPILAREYLHDKAKTTAAFIENPAWMAQIRGQLKESERLYKTGDLVKYNPDGSIAFIGRRDNQVKLHGQRMELGEIESQFALHDQIRHGVVMLPKAGLCKERLVAVVSMSRPTSAAVSSTFNACNLIQGQALAEAQAQIKIVRESMSTKLPHYMMPTIWVIVEAIPLLVSGKLDRRQVENWIKEISQPNYQHIVADEQVPSEEAPITETVQQLRNVWASVFNSDVDSIDPGRSFMSQGGDSLISMSIIARCRKIGITLSLQEVLQSKSLFQLANTLDSRGHSTQKMKAASIEEKTDQEFDLSPVQRLYFDMVRSSTDLTHEGRFNQSQLLRLNRKTLAKTVQDAIGVIVQQHSMFRARFRKDQKGVWHQLISPRSADSYRFREHQVNNTNELIQRISESQNCLDLAKGPLFAVDLFDSKHFGQVLSLVAHHLIIDVVSWSIVMQQLEDLLTFQMETIEKPLSYQVWCRLQSDHACQRNVSTVKEVLPFRVMKADIASWGMTDRSNVYGDVEQANFTLDRQNTELALGNSNNALRTQTVEIFIAALFSSFRKVFQERAMPTIFNESHGRDTWDTAVDPTATTGWFTSIYPIAIPQEDRDVNAIELLKRVKDMRRSLPANGREYFDHRYLTPDGRWRFSDHMPMEILLNYTGQSRSGGQTKSLLQPYEFPKTSEDEMLTADVGPKAVRMALFEISVAVVNEQARFSFMWNNNMKHQKEIHRWVKCCQATLDELTKCLAGHQPEPTLSDYPLLPTSHSGLRKHVTETLHEIGISSLDEVEDMYVTAPTQEGLLLSQIRNPNQYVNYVISQVQLAGRATRIDVQRMVRAWQKVVDRHQSLRTVMVYSVCKGHAFDQIALKQAQGGAKVLHCEDEDYEKALNTVSLKEVNRTRRPELPHQLTLCTTKSGLCYTKLELNHAVIDGGSGALITRDLAMAYEGCLPEGPKPLYSDYVKYISSREEGTDVAFWKTYLSGIARCHLPPLDPAPANANRLNGIYLDFRRFDELQAFCRANEMTLSNVMLAAWGLVLRHYTSRDDVCFGNLTAGRDAPVDGIQDIVGAFINMLVCRVNFQKAKTIKDVIRKVQSDFLGSLPHQHCSLAKLQHDLGLSREPLFNTAVSIQNQISSRDAEMEGDAIEIEPITNYDPSEVC